MSRQDLLKPAIYTYRDVFEVRVFYEPDGKQFSLEYEKRFINLKTLEFATYEDVSECLVFSRDLEDLLLQADLFLFKQKMSDKY